MGMILGHHIPGRLGPAAAADSCSYSVKSDDPTPEFFSSPGGSRRDVVFRPDGLRAWTHWTVSVGGFDTHQYDLAAPWQLTGWSNNGNILKNTGLNRSMTWHDNGNKLTFLRRWFSSNRRVDTWDQSATPYDISAGLGPVFASFVGLVGGGGEYLARFSLDGFHLFINRVSVELRRYTMTVAHDISTITGVTQFWSGAAFGFGDTWGFSADHTRIYFQSALGQVLASIDLTAPDDISAPFNFTSGVSVNLPTNLQNARGLTVVPSTGDVILLADQNNQRIRCWAGGVAPTVDANFNDVVLLLDFAGPDGGTNITDLSNSSHNETFFDNAQIDITERSLGNNTLQLDGAGDYVTFPDSADWDFGTGDFSIEFTVEMDTLGVTQTFMGNYLTGAGNDKGVGCQFLSVGNLFRVFNGDSILFSVNWPGVLANTTYFIEVSRAGTDLRVFIDGVQLGPTVVDSTNFTGAVQPWRLGTLDGAAQFTDGHIGSVRITKGVARNITNYTPPSCFYPSDPVPASPVLASGAPSITKPIATPPGGSATHTPAAATGYTFGGATPLLAIGDSSVGFPHTIGPPAGTQVGDLLVMWAIGGPGYVGQSSLFLREAISLGPWSSAGAISIISSDTGDHCITIAPRIADGTGNDSCRQNSLGPWPLAMQMANFLNPWTLGLGSITADNEASETFPDASLFREDAPNNGFDHLLDVFATAKRASAGVIGNTVSGDAGEPSIVLLGGIDYVDNGFGQGLVGAFGYRITPDGNPGIPVGNWGSSILESNDTFAVSARWKSADS